MEYGSFISRREKEAAFLRQKETLDVFLERGAITKAQYDKSLGDLIVLMGMQGVLSSEEEKR